MDRIAIFIDGAHLSKLLSIYFGKIKIDYAKLAHWIADGSDILRVYYYDCLPYQSNPPTPTEHKLYSSRRAFHYNLNRLPKFEVKEGKLAYRGTNQNGDPIFEQKMVDIMLAVDLVNLSFKRVISRAAIITGDSDFIPAIQVSKGEGIAIQLIHGPTKSFHDKLWNEVDERRNITQTILNQCKL
jgi:uncharacterized LabA/DUF88 family protein